VRSLTARKNNIANPFVKETGMAGRAWVEGSLPLKPIIASFKAQNLSHGKAQKLNRFIVKDYFMFMVPCIIIYSMK
jgi:hypothetical protein